VNNASLRVPMRCMRACLGRAAEDDGSTHRDLSCMRQEKRGAPHQSDKFRAEGRRLVCAGLRRDAPSCPGCGFGGAYACCCRSYGHDNANENGDGEGVNLPNAPGPARDAAIVSAVQSGMVEASWWPIQNSFAGHTGQFTVFADALKLDGVRLSGSARLAQIVADLLGCLLITPRLSDLAWLQATVRIAPQPMYPVDASTAGMVRESQLMDAAIGGRQGLVAPIGKNWVLSGHATPARAVLYGWQSPTADNNGVTPGIRVIQPVSTAHNPQYTDYSMLISLVQRACVVDGLPRDLADVVRDPALAGLASHEGALPFYRQPGVPVVAAPSA
jgi:hypothetical protein